MDRKNTEERVHNLEVALVSLLAFIDDILPPEISRQTDRMMEEFFQSSETLGAFKKNTFNKK